MRKRRRKGIFGVSENSVSLEFSGDGPACDVYDLSPFGIPWVPVIGRVTVRKCDKPVSWHVHEDCTEVICCLSGMCEYDVQGKTYCLRPGHVLISRPDEPHRQRSNPKGLVTCYLFFRAPQTAGRSKTDEEVRWIDGELRKLPRFFSVKNSVAQMFNRIFSIVSAPGCSPVEQRLRLRTAVSELFLDLMDSTTLSVSNVPTEGVRRIAERMRRQPECAYPLGRVAAEVGLSTSAFLNAFRSTIGFTPHVYLTNCRIERAKELLRAGSCPPAVADALGYSSRQHFSSAFKNVTGLSPSVWRLRA